MVCKYELLIGMILQVPPESDSHHFSIETKQNNIYILFEVILGAVH